MAALLAATGCHVGLQRDAPDAAGLDAAFGDAGELGDARPGTPCAEPSLRACAGDDQPVVCNGARWQADVPCETGELCTAGRCVPDHTFSHGSLSGDARHSCVIDDAGALYCWGPALGADPGALPLPSAASPQRIGDLRWQQVAVGSTQACAIRDDSSLWCWGTGCTAATETDPLVEATQPARVGETSRWASVAVGDGLACALDQDGALSCWGRRTDPEAGCSPVPTPGHPASPIAGAFTHVAIGDASVYLLQATGELMRSSDRPEGAPQQPFTAAARVGTATWRTIDAGPGSVCGVRQDHSLACAGDADAEETAVGSSSAWGQVATAATHTCAIRLDGTLWCFGANDNGQLGLGTAGAPIAEPAQVGGAAGWLAVSAHTAGSCALRDERLQCWGSNLGGELGIGDLPVRTTPARVGHADAWSAPTTGKDSSCALQGKVLHCWGSNAQGQLGLDDPSSQLAPVEVPGQFQVVRTFGSTRCAVDDAEGLYCFGAGVGKDGGRARFLEGTQVAALGSGSSPCVVRTDGAVLCGTDPAALAAAQPIVGLVARSVTASPTHSCAIAIDGSLLCWGSNARGELGSGTLGGTLSLPTAVAGGGRFLAISVSATGCSCGITDEGAAGRLFCWGAGDFGCFGAGAAEDSGTPVQVGADGDWRAVSVGSKRVCGVRGDAELWCWGDDLDGGLGVGGEERGIRPATRIAPEGAWLDVSVAVSHSCATAADGSLSCWGIGEAGQLGDGSAFRLMPTDVVLR